MRQWISDLLFGPPYSGAKGTEWPRGETRSLRKQLEQSVAWSSFLASGVDGVEDVSFAEFVRRSSGSNPSDPN